MLDLFARLKVVLPGWNFGLLPNTLTPAEGGQRRIGNIGATRDQFLMDPDEIAFA